MLSVGFPLRISLAKQASLISNVCFERIPPIRGSGNICVRPQVWRPELHGFFNIILFAGSIRLDYTKLKVWIAKFISLREWAKREE